MASPGTRAALSLITSLVRTEAFLQAEVISIGDELTSGQRLDTNTQWLSQQLGDLGIPTIRHTTVGDDLSGNVEALRLAAQRADVVVCTGGLGPTQDDLTRQAIADAFGRPLALDEASLAHIRELFARRKREMPERNRTQAMIPAGSQVIPNPHGSAPGIDLAIETESLASRIFALPGVPAEMKQMWHETLVQRLEKALSRKQGRLRYHAIKLFGIGESDVEVKLPHLIDRQRVPTVGITVSRATITLRIAARAHGDEEFQKLISPTIAEIEEAVGELIFGQGQDELEHAVLRHLEQRGFTLATVEVGAGSWVCDWMQKCVEMNERTIAPGPYVGGIAFPTPELARRWLSGSSAPPTASLESDPLWSTLARQACDRFQADVGLALGVYPSVGQMEQASQPFDLVFAMAAGEHLHVEQRSMGGHPDVLGPRIAKTGLDIVRKRLKGWLA